MEVNQIVRAGDSADIGQAMQNLIQDNLARLNVCFLAKVQSVNGNKVDVVQVMQDKENERLVIPSVIVGIPQSQDLQISMKIQEGDFGVCVVCDCDISGYKQSGDSSQKLTNRTHNLIDSVFIPLSLFKSDLEKSGILANSDFSIEAKGEVGIKSEKDFSIEATGDLSLNGKLLVLKSQTASLKTALSELSDYITQIATTGGYTIDPASIAKFNTWKANLDKLFKE